jgi:hypothetical protein
VFQVFEYWLIILHYNSNLSLGAANTAPRSGLQKDLTNTFYWGFQAPEDEIWKTKGKMVAWGESSTQITSY